MNKRSATVVGSGPNGLAAAIELARNGLLVQVLEAAETPGGAARSAQITLPGFVHDLGSAVHPMGVASPFFSKLGLHAHGLHWRWSPIELAHPLDDGTAVVLRRSVDDTAAGLGEDAGAYRALFKPVVRDWTLLSRDVLGPLLHIPRHPIALAAFGLRALPPASALARVCFRGERARALFAGLAAHSILKLSAPISSAFALMLGGVGHAVGWPIPMGGAGQIARALVSVLEQYGAVIKTRHDVTRLPQDDITMLDLTPRGALALNDAPWPPHFRKALAGFEYGPGIFKLDWALRSPIPWRASECREAITVHVGGTLEEIERSEAAASEGLPPVEPFIILAQPSLFDDTRAPASMHTAWAYCHVPNGWTGSAQEQIEAQIERFAPGFRSCILARAAHSAPQLQAWNGNLVGGDIGGGACTLKQFALRPTWRSYRTPLPGVFLCSSSTPPGGGVHGMCGAQAARAALGLPFI